MRWLEQRKQMFYITFVLCRLSRYSVAYGIPQESMYHHAKFHWNSYSGLAVEA